MGGELLTRRRVLVSVLKLTKNGPVEERLVRKDAGVPAEVLDSLLKEIENLGLIRRRRGAVEASRFQRVKIALHILRLGGDPERACEHLEWDEFEDVTVVAFEINGYAVRKHFRFKWAGRRWEIDVLGCKRPYIVCVDCKHLRKRWAGSTVTKAVEMQMQRVSMLSEALPFLREAAGVTSWKKAYLIPTVLSLLPAPSKFYGGVPVVPILQLQDFLGELPAHLRALAFKLVHLDSL